MKTVLLDAGVKQAGATSAVTDRITGMIPLVVSRMRGTVRAGGRNELSAETDTVPPEAKVHAVVLVAKGLVQSVGVLQQFAKSFDNAVTKAEGWLDSVRDGMAVTPPSEPLGILRGPQWGGPEKVDLATL